MSEWKFSIHRPVAAAFEHPGHCDADQVKSDHGTAPEEEVQGIGGRRHDGRYYDDQQKCVAKIFPKESRCDQAEQGEKGHQHRKLKNGAHAHQDQHFEVEVFDGADHGREKSSEFVDQEIQSDGEDDVIGKGTTEDEQDCGGDKKGNGVGLFFSIQPRSNELPRPAAG